MPLKPALIELIPYPDPEDPDFPSFAEASRLAICEEHGLERVVSMRTIPTGPGDLCDVGVFACGSIVTEDVF